MVSSKNRNTKKAQRLKLKSIDTNHLPNYVILHFESKTGLTKYTHTINVFNDLSWWIRVLKECRRDQ